MTKKDYSVSDYLTFASARNAANVAKSRAYSNGEDPEEAYEARFDSFMGSRSYQKDYEKLNLNTNIQDSFVFKRARDTADQSAHEALRLGENLISASEIAYDSVLKSNGYYKIWTN